MAQLDPRTQVQVGLALFEAASTGESPTADALDEAGQSALWSTMLKLTLDFRLAEIRGDVTADGRPAYVAAAGLGLVAIGSGWLDRDEVVKAGLRVGDLLAERLRDAEAWAAQLDDT